MNARIAGAIATGALAGPALAQENVHFTLSYAHAILSPGEHQTISVAAAYSPGAGGVADWNTLGGTGQTGTVWCLSVAIWDIVNVTNGETGEFSNPRVEPSLNAYSIAGVPDASGNWIGIWDFQLGFPLGIPPDIRNPLPLFTIDWTPTDYLARNVDFGTRLSYPERPSRVLINVGLAVPAWDNWTSSFGDAGFTIVPAPASVMLAGLASMTAWRRRVRRLPP